MSESPKQLGYTMPAEWEKHNSIWMAWPHDKVSFPDRIEKVEKAYVEIIYALYRYEVVRLLVLDDAMQDRAEMLLTGAGVDLSQVVFYQVNYADVWTRDYGPVFVKNSDGEVAWVKWQNDAYGKKFEELLIDNEVFKTLKDNVGYKMFETKFVLEGGAVEVNGAGTLLTTEQCLLRNRNNGKTKEENEAILKEMLGVKNIIWLKDGLMNDHTDGHIDEVARFVSPTKILCAYEENEADENYEILKENFEILENTLDHDGNKFEVIKLPMPHMTYDDGTKAPVSYANFYIGNEVVLASIFNDPNDTKALEILQSCFPDKKVIGIVCTDLIYGGGGIHCITQQEPS